MNGMPLANQRLIVLLTLLAATAACMDNVPVTSPEELPGEEVADAAGNQNFVAAVACRANATEGELYCGPVPMHENRDYAGPQRVIVGGQDQYVTLTSSNVSYDAGDRIFQADVTVTNLIAQGLGSPDGGVTTTGVRVFHHTGPTTTGGTGTVTVANADGTATFTGANQPYFHYDLYLPPDATSPAKTWEWNLTPGVTAFEFEVFVAADVWGEEGYVDVTPSSNYTTVGGSTIALTATVRDVVDRPIGGSVTWTSTNTGIATVDPASGVVTAVAPGVVDIVASTGGPEADGRARITVDPFLAGYQIVLHFLTPMTTSQQAAFTDAAARWQSLITGDLAPVWPMYTGNECGMPIDEVVDDLAINVWFEDIDGVGKVLGSAGPCLVRTSTGLPAYGRMRFDISDVAQLEADGQFDEVVLHEMAHVLGFGVLWIGKSLLSDDSGLLDDCFPVGSDPEPPLTTDPYFNGPSTIVAFDNNGGSDYAGSKVPVENDYGRGTRCGHWRETVLDTELMTGFAESPLVAMPLSEVTVKSFAEMGYTVAASGWDTWSCPFCAPPAPGAPTAITAGGGRQLLNDIWLGPIYAIDEAGQISLARPDLRRR
jgi:hypothetical protein